MKTSEVSVVETMEDVQTYIKKWMRIHPDVVLPARILSKAIDERWPGLDTAAVLERAELNSINRLRVHVDPPGSKRNQFIDTEVQGDLFHHVPVRIPKVLLIDGEPMPYYKVSVAQGLAWWSARASEKASEAAAFEEAAKVRREEEREAAEEVGKLRQIIAQAQEHGLDIAEIKYAKASE